MSGFTTVVKTVAKKATGFTTVVKTVAKKTIGLEHMQFQPLGESYHFAHTRFQPLGGYCSFARTGPRIIAAPISIRNSHALTLAYCSAERETRKKHPGRSTSKKTNIRFLIPPTPPKQC